MCCGLKCEVRLGKDHRHFRSRMDANVQNMFEINYSHLIQYEILEKLVTFIIPAPDFISGVQGIVDPKSGKISKQEDISLWQKQSLAYP